MLRRAQYVGRTTGRRAPSPKPYSAGCRSAEFSRSSVTTPKGERIMAKGVARAAFIAGTMVAAATLLGAMPAQAASLVEITGFGQNPTNLRMHVYAPDARPT